MSCWGGEGCSSLAPSLMAARRSSLFVSHKASLMASRRAIADANADADALNFFGDAVRHNATGSYNKLNRRPRRGAIFDIEYMGYAAPGQVQLMSVNARTLPKYRIVQECPWCGMGWVDHAT
jgi:hypothetical protein